MFKVGDRVRIIESVVQHSLGFNIGDIRTITKVDADDPQYTYKLNEVAKGNWHWACEQELELVEINNEEERKEEKKEEIKMEKDLMKETLEQKIIDSILPDIKKQVMKQCKDITKNITTVVVKLDEEIIKKSTENTHNKFKDLLTLVNNNIPAMLTGGAGSGKSSTCEKVAKVLRTRLLF